MKTEKKEVVCDRCGKPIETDIKSKNYTEGYATLDYRYHLSSGKYCTYQETYTPNGEWEDIDLCPDCAYTFNTLIGLYGFSKLYQRTTFKDDQKIIDIKR